MAMVERGRVRAPAAMAVTAALILSACGSNRDPQAGEGKNADQQVQVVAVQLTDQGCSPTTAEASAGPTTFEATTDRTDEPELEILDGDIAEAKDLFAYAREPYERIEPIAEALGDLDPAIDAREGDVPEAKWTGFHRIEKALWVDQDWSRHEPTVERTQRDHEAIAAAIAAGDAALAERRMHEHLVLAVEAFTGVIDDVDAAAQAATARTGEGGQTCRR